MLSQELESKVIDLLNAKTQGITIALLSEKLNVSRDTMISVLAKMHGKKLILVKKIGLAKLIFLKEKVLDESEFVNKV
jgi:lambda repressor-like predicted transcriptional regulator